MNSVHVIKTDAGTTTQLAGSTLKVTGRDIESDPVEYVWVSDGTAHELILRDGNYILEELESPQGYDRAKPIPFQIQDGELIVDGGVHTDLMINVENSLTPLTAVTVNKQWQDAENSDRVRPNSVRVELLADGLPVMNTIAPENSATQENNVPQESDIRTLHTGNGWQATWTDLPVHTIDGKAIKYTVREILDDQISETNHDKIGDHYHVTVRDRPWSQGQAYQITNIHQPTSVDLDVTAIWDDNNNQDGKRPTGIGMTVWGVSVDNNGTIRHRDQLLTVDASDWTSDVAQLDMDGNWHWTLHGLPPRDGDGNVYTRYEIRETVPDEYTAIETDVCKPADDNSQQKNAAMMCTPTQTPTSSDGNAAQSGWKFEFKNQYVPQTIDIKVQVTWEDRMHPSARPNAASVWLLHSSEPNMHGWTPVTPPIGTAQASVVQASTSFIEAVNEQESTTPSSTNGTATCNPQGARCVTLQAGEHPNVWTATFTGLPKYANGQLIWYAITEEQIDDYTASIDPALQPSTGASAVVVQQPQQRSAIRRAAGVSSTANSAGMITLGLINTVDVVMLPSTGGAGNSMLIYGLIAVIIAVCAGAGLQWRFQKGTRVR